VGKRIMGKVSRELKTEGRIQIYVARDDISTDEEKTMYNVVFKNYWILAILLGFVERFQNAGGETSGSYLWFDGFGSLKTASSL
jgi:hypothetical protein